MKSLFNEALDFFLDDQKMLDSIDNPDEGIDYIFMLDIDDWKTLEIEWDKRSNHWKSAMTFFAGNIPLQMSAGILFKSISDTDVTVVEEGLLSIYQSIEEETKECGTLNYKISEQEKKLILDKIMQYDPEEYPEFEELKGLLI